MATDIGGLWGQSVIKALLERNQKMVMRGTKEAGPNSLVNFFEELLMDILYVLVFTLVDWPNQRLLLFNYRLLPGQTRAVISNLLSALWCHTPHICVQQREPPPSWLAVYNQRTTPRAGMGSWPTTPDARCTPSTFLVRCLPCISAITTRSILVYHKTEMKFRILNEWISTCWVLTSMKSNSRRK